jgi:hypothetical protein
MMRADQPTTSVSLHRTQLVLRSVRAFKIVQVVRILRINTPDCQLYSIGFSFSSFLIRIIRSFSQIRAVARKP